MASSASTHSSTTRSSIVHRHIRTGAKTSKEVEHCQADKDSPATVLIGNEKAFDRPTPPPYQQSSGLIWCGICKRSFPYSRPEALLAHLSGHFDLQHEHYRCHRCQINFVREADLRSHLTSATLKKQCGFMFEHKEACTGHHPPRHKILSDHEFEDRSRYSLMRNKDDARFDFCYRLQNWEQVQLRSFYQRIIPTATPPTPKKNKRRMWSSLLRNLPCLRHLDSSSSLGSNAALGTTQSPPNGVSKEIIVANADALGAILLRAICTGSYNMVAALVHAGANIHVQDSFGYGPLHYAARYAHTDVLRLLARTGIYLGNLDDEGTTALAHAVKIGRADIVSCFLDLGAQLNFDFLRRSVVNGDVDTAEILLGHWTKGHRSLHSLDSLLLAAAWNRDKAMTELLLAHGAAASAKDNVGNTAMSVASALGHRELVHLLFEHGAELEWWENDFKEYRHVAMVEKMLSQRYGDSEKRLSAHH